jgi:WD40 repeat protein
MQKIYEFPAHDERVLCSALSPDGCTVVTGACDENLKVTCSVLPPYLPLLISRISRLSVLENLGSKNRVQSKDSG